MQSNNPVFRRSEAFNGQTTAPIHPPIHSHGASTPSGTMMCVIATLLGRVVPSITW